MAALCDPGFWISRPMRSERILPCTASAQRLQSRAKADGWLPAPSPRMCRARSSRYRCSNGSDPAFPIHSETKCSPSCATSSAVTQSRSPDPMDVLCFDIGTGGVRGARFNEQLEVLALHEAPWDLHRDAEGRATLSVYDIECAFSEVARALRGDSSTAAVTIGCFMHSFLVLSSCCAALTPVFTWLDTTGPEGIDAVRR